MGKVVLRVVVSALALSVLYTILGSLAGSYFVEHELRKLFDQPGEQNLAIGASQFNPFTLSAALDDLSLNEANGTAFLTVEGVRLNFSIIGLLQQQFILGEASLRKPKLVVDISNPPQPGLVRLLALLSNMRGPTDGASGIQIEQASVEGGSIYFEHGPERLARQVGTTEPFEMTLDEISLQISHYQGAGAKPAGLELATRINESSMLRAKGQLLPSSGTIEASVQMDALDLSGFRSLIGSNSVIQHLSGRMRADGLLSHKPGDTRFAGDMAFEHLETGVTPQGRPLFSTGELMVRDAEIGGWPLRVSTRLLEFKQPRLELEIAGTGDPTGSTIGHDSILSGLRGAFSSNGTTIAVSDGQVRITDPRLDQGVRIGLERVTGAIASHASESSQIMKVQLSASMGESGPVTLGSVLRFSDDHGQEAEGVAGEVTAELDMRQDDVSFLSAYAARFAGREISSDTLDLDLRYRLDAGTLAVSSAISFGQLALGPRSAPAPKHDLPLELTIALFTDTLGETHFDFPFLRHLADSDGSVPVAIEFGLSDFIAEVTTRPFSVLENLVGFSEAPLDTIVFDPGSAAISPLAEKQLIALGEALDKRPGLGLRAISGQARQADRDALARRQVSLHVTLAASTRPSGRSDQKIPDFTDPKVQTVMDEFASTRLGANELARLDARQDLNEISDGTSPAAYYGAVFEALVAQEPVADNSLRQLARYRAQSVIRKLGTLGIASDRLQTGNSQQADDPPISLQVFTPATTVTRLVDFPTPR